MARKKKKKGFRRIIKKIGKVAGKILPIAAPLAGNLFGGVLGGAAGTALGTAGGLIGSRRKNRKKRLLSGLATGAGITAGFAALNVAQGLPLTTSGIDSIGKLFGGGGGGDALPNPEDLKTPDFNPTTGTDLREQLGDLGGSGGDGVTDDVLGNARDLVNRAGGGEFIDGDAGGGTGESSGPGFGMLALLALGVFVLAGDSKAA